MEVFIIHIAKSSAILLVAYWVYLLLVRFTTFHYLNRSYLLICVCLSLLIPFIHFPVEESHAVYTYTLPTIDLVAEPVASNPQSNFNLTYTLWCLYVLIGLALTLRLVYYITDLLKMLYKHPKIKMGKFTLIRSNASDQAFSFFKYIVVPQYLKRREEQIIIEHEMLHAHKWHSIDVLFMEVVKIIFWFHPAIYLLKRELIQQHEFEIDRLLTSQTIDIEQYGNLLIQQAQQIPVQLSLTNNFNHSLIKNRIKMMTKPKSNKIQLLRYAILIPLIGIICTFIACEKRIVKNTTSTLQVDAKKKKLNSEPKNGDKIVEAEFIEIEETEDKQHIITDEVFTIVEKMPEFLGGTEALLEFFGNKIKLPKAAKENDIQGVVVLGFTVEKDGSISNLNVVRDIGGGCGEEATRVAKQMPKWSPGMQNGQTVRVAFRLPIRFKIDGDDPKAKDKANSNPPNFSDERKEALTKLFNSGVKKVTFEEENPAILSIAQVMPQFPGGDEALLTYFGSKIKYPEIAKKDSIQGVVVLDFIVEKDGSISDLKVLRDIGGGCGEEAIRIAKLMPKWSPGKQDGQTVRVGFKLPIRFKLDSTDLNSCKEPKE